jgi:cbb3-type cytochrome oxidase cytochrome c subunit
MKGLLPLFLGIFGTFAFSWVGLIFVPNLQIGHLDPQTDEEGGDVYPAPRSGMAERGRHIYLANGCNYCHSQQVRADYAASDIDRKWGARRSAPRDYIFDRPVLLGKMRMGPDLANVGHRAPVKDENVPPPGSTPSPIAGSPVAAAGPATSPAPAAASPAVAANAPSSSPSPVALAAPALSPVPASATTSAPPASAQTPTPAANPSATNEVATTVSGEPLPYSAAWHHRHLYNPRSITLDSTMPAYRFLYAKQRREGQPAADALKLTGEEAVPDTWEIVPTYDAKCLVAYLMSLDQSHGLKEVKSTAPASPPAPGQQAK